MLALPDLQVLKTFVNPNDILAFRSHSMAPSGLGCWSSIHFWIYYSSMEYWERNISMSGSKSKLNTKRYIDLMNLISLLFSSRSYIFCAVVNILSSSISY